MTTSPLPTVDENYVRQVFSALELMEVPLDSDPIMFGPRRLNSKVALCRQHLTRCQQIFLQVSNDLQRLNRAHRQAKLDFDLRMQDLFANDPDVRAGKNVRDREAIATMKLREEREEIQVIESSVQDLEAIMTVVKARREDLKDVQGRLRDQFKLCQEDIGLGSRWGSALPPGAAPVTTSSRPQVDTAALEAMHQLVGGIEGETDITHLEAFVQQEAADSASQPLMDDPLADDILAAFPVGAVGGKESAPVASEEEEEEESAPVTREEEEEEPAPAVLDEEEEAEETLPKIEAQGAPGSDTSAVQDIDSFLDSFVAEEESSSKKAKVEVSPLAGDVDLDDLLGLS